MKNAKFSITEYLILLLLFLTVLAITVIPVINLREGAIYVAQIIVFFLILLVNIDSNVFIKNVSLRFNTFIFLFSLSVIFFIISSFYANLEYNTNAKSILKLITYPIIVFLFLFYFPRILFQNDELFEKVLNFWLYFSIGCNLIGFAFMILDYFPLSKYSEQTTSIFGHPNTFSIVFVIAIPIVIYKYFVKKINFFTFLIYAIFLFNGLLFTFSRSGYIGVFASTLILTYRKSKLIFVIGILTLVFLASTFFIDFAFSKGEGSSLSRAQIMYAAYNMIVNVDMTRFLWGYGIFNNVSVFSNEIKLINPYRDEVDPHNFVLLLGIEFGVLFTISIISAVVFLLLKTSFIDKKKHSFGVNQKINLSISVILGLLMQNLFEDVVVYPEYFVMSFFLIFVGYLYQASYNSQEINKHNISTN